MLISHHIYTYNMTDRLRETIYQQQITGRKLASGMRINQASDDAAGLSIANKMNAQLRAMKQAQRNTQDGISELKATC